MRVISGLCGGRKLQTPADTSVRPTTDKVKEALFSSIQFELEGARVLDLFAGSGQLGIEALSRGAAAAVFVDNSKASLALVQKNLALCGLQGDLVHADAAAYLTQSTTPFDIAFLDPPYSTGLLQQLLPQVSSVMSDTGVICAECPFGESVPQTLSGGFALAKSKKYGTMALHFYRKEL